MGRRWLWLVGLIVLLGAALYIVLAVTPPPAPYKFLEGQRPVKFEELENRAYTWYSFEAESKEVDARARRELESLGLSGGPLDRQTSLYQKPVTRMGSTKDWCVDVFICHDTKAPATRAEWRNAAGKSPGWTTVVVVGVKPKRDGLLDKLRRWLGM